MPRFRLFAGPNGSGKTTYFESLKEQKFINTEIYISADAIEAEMKKVNFYNISKLKIKANQDSFRKHILNSGLFTKSKMNKQLENEVFIKEDKIYFKVPQINSYHASFVASYLVERLFASKQSFCFETVMSHPSKIEILKLAKKLGYKTYLYFIFTSNVKLNLIRIQERVKQGLHNVSEKKVRQRFKKSIENLKLAMLVADVGYIINNSSLVPIIEFQKTNNTISKLVDYKSYIQKYI